MTGLILSTAGFAFVVFLLTYNIVNGNASLIPVDAAGVVFNGVLVAVQIVLLGKR